jgi:hypothetical protein
MFSFIDCRKPHIFGHVRRIQLPHLGSYNPGPQLLSPQIESDSDNLPSWSEAYKTLKSDLPAGGCNLNTGGAKRHAAAGPLGCWEHGSCLRLFRLGQPISAKKTSYIAGWWLSRPSEKYEFVKWDDDIPIYYGK